MTAEEKTITLFSTRVRQLMLQYDKLRKENMQLKKTLQEREAEINNLEAMVKSTQDDYNSLMASKMLQAGEGDTEAAKARLAKLIRSVNKCITMLSEK